MWICGCVLRNVNWIWKWRPHKCILTVIDVYDAIQFQPISVKCCFCNTSFQCYGFNSKINSRVKMSRRRKFTQHEEDLLIDFVKSHPFLYDKKHHDYRKIELRDKTWKKFAKQININSEYLNIIYKGLDLHDLLWLHKFIKIKYNCSEIVYTSMVQYARLLQEQNKNSKDWICNSESE